MSQQLMAAIPARIPSRLSRWVRVVVALTLSLVVALLSACGAATPGIPGTSRTGSSGCNMATQWHIPANNAGLDDLAMVGPDEGWAVGATTSGIPATTSPAGVIFHLTHGQWQRLPQTYPGAELSSISMDSPNDGWAVAMPLTIGAGIRVPVLHYSGGVWRTVDVPALDAALVGPPGTSGGIILGISVRMFGPSAGWMFAWTNIPRSPGARSGEIVLRYQQGVWTPIPAPKVAPSTDLFDLSAVSANEAWIVGTDYGNDLKTLFAHYVNGAWSLWPKTFPGVTERLTMLSPTDGWAFDQGGGPSLLLHYDGTAWAPVATPASWTSQQIQFSSRVFAVAPGVTWFSVNPIGTMVPPTVMEQYAAGHWQQIAWPFSDVAPEGIAPGATGELWGIGNIGHQEGCPPALTIIVPQGVFLHFQQGEWTRDILP